MSKIQIIGFAVLIGLCGLLLWKVDSQSNKIDTLTQDLETANTTIEIQNSLSDIVEEQNASYQMEITRLNNDARRVRSQPSKCVAVTSETSTRPDGGQGGQYDRVDGIGSGWLREYSILAEQIRVDRNDCYDYINRVWDRFNQ